MAFPRGIMTIELKYLTAAASMCEPLGGIVLQESDVAKAWPGEAGLATFLELVSTITLAVPWLLLGTLSETKTRVAALRNAGFHATWLDPRNLDRRRFESWVLLGQRRATQQWRRFQKSA